MKKSFVSDIGQSFARPFSRQGIKRLAVSILLSIIPFLGYLGRSVAYSYAVDDSEASLKKNIGKTFRMIWVSIVYSAPIFLCFALANFFGFYMPNMPGILVDVCNIVMIVFVVRGLILMPLSWCAIALGAPMRIALSSKAMKGILSGCLGRYIVSTLISGVILFAGCFTGKLGAIPGYIVSAVISVLYNFISARLYMSAFLSSSDVNASAGGASSFGRPIRIAAVGMIFVLGIQTCVPVSAAEVPSDAVIGYDSEEKYSVNLENVLQYTRRSNEYTTYLNGYSDKERAAMLREKAGITETYLSGYSDEELAAMKRAERIEESRKKGEYLINESGWICLDTTLSCIPATSSIWSGIMTVKELVQAASTDGTESEEHLSMALYNAAGIALGAVQSIEKAANAVFAVGALVMGADSQWTLFSGKESFIGEYHPKYTLKYIGEYMDYADENISGWVNYVSEEAIDEIFKVDYQGIKPINRYANDDPFTTPDYVPDYGINDGTFDTSYNGETNLSQNMLKKLNGSYTAECLNGFPESTDYLEQYGLSNLMSVEYAKHPVTIYVGKDGFYSFSTVFETVIKSNIAGYEGTSSKGEIKVEKMPLFYEKSSVKGSFSIKLESHSYSTVIQMGWTEYNGELIQQPVEQEVDTVTYNNVEVNFVACLDEKEEYYFKGTMTISPYDSYTQSIQAGQGIPSTLNLTFECR